MLAKMLPSKQPTAWRLVRKPWYLLLDHLERNNLWPLYVTPRYSPAQLLTDSPPEITG